MLRINVNAVVENRKGQILFVRLKKGRFKNRLSLPGGGLEFGETSCDAVAREIVEETGLAVEDESLSPIGFCELVNQNKNDHRIVLLFRALANGQPTETDEAIPCWRYPEQVSDQLLPFAAEALARGRVKMIHFTIDQDTPVQLKSIGPLKPEADFE